MTSSPNINVGIISRKQLKFRFSGNFSVQGKKIDPETVFTASVKNNVLHIEASNTTLSFEHSVTFTPGDIDKDKFEIKDVLIGVDFHWQQEEDQIFQGALQLLLKDAEIIAINIVPLENYLYSVISSEMNPNASLNLLKAHAIISRGWLMAQLERNGKNNKSISQSATDENSEGELIRWFDKDEHIDFHICADDHCQRYQGIIEPTNENVLKAVKETRGEVLFFEDEICDARFSKCCGGLTELFENCWEPVHHPYLESFPDIFNTDREFRPATMDEASAEEFIRSDYQAFCNTSDKKILSQVLKDYDNKTEDFFRWTIRYKQEKLSGLIRERSGIDFGEIVSLEPLLRGASGRLIKLKIEGTKKTMVIGKELLIRKWLSTSHLYSSAFIVETEPGKEAIPAAFKLIGAGWGHGVGLCQIGAAVMGEEGYSYLEILEHYFPGTEIRTIYN